MNPNKVLIKKLNDLLHCSPNRCDGCSVQMQDEGDENPWCEVDSVLRQAISSIEYLDKIDK